MTETDQQNVVFKTLSRGCLAELREIVEHCEDREVSRVIYTEIKRLWHQMERKHGFGKKSVVK